MFFQGLEEISVKILWKIQVWKDLHRFWGSLGGHFQRCWFEVGLSLLKVCFSLGFYRFFEVFLIFHKKHSILHGRGAKWSQKTDTPHAEKKSTCKKPSVFDTRDPFWLWKQRVNEGSAEARDGRHHLSLVFCDAPGLGGVARNPSVSLSRGLRF